MTRRSRAREIALQLLFWRDMNTTALRPAVEQFVHDRLRAPALEPFCLSLYDDVVNRGEEIDNLLRRAAENWRLPRMAGVDRNILRLGTAELRNKRCPPAIRSRACVKPSPGRQRRVGLTCTCTRRTATASTRLLR